jgi:hypothetical protein
VAKREQLSDRDVGELAPGLFGEVGNDSIDAGPGNDIVSVPNSPGVISVEGGEGYDQLSETFNTMLVNQVLRADRPSKSRKCRYPERNAFWTASSASSLFRRME